MRRSIFIFRTEFFFYEFATYKMYENCFLNKFIFIYNEILSITTTVLD